VPTFARGASSYELFRQHALLLAQLAREAGGNVAEETQKARERRHEASAANLRGIPCVGHGVAGEIRGTGSEREALRRDGR
jgi:hypothetical protein